MLIKAIFILSFYLPNGEIGKVRGTSEVDCIQTERQVVPYIKEKYRAREVNFACKDIKPRKDTLVNPYQQPMMKLKKPEIFL